MVLNQYFAALLGGILLAWSGASRADGYRPDEFLKLDLPQAVLSPKLLGPPTQFEPVAVEAKADPGVTAKPVHAAQVKSVHTAEVKSVSAAKPSCTGSSQGGPPAQQSARRPGIRHPDSGLALPLRRNLRLAALAQFLRQGRIKARRRASRFCPGMTNSDAAPFACTESPTCRKTFR